MKWNTWILFALAAVLVTGVLAMVTRQSKSTPEDFFAAVQKRMAAGRYAPEQAVENLTQVLDSAQASGDSELAARVLLLRGQTLRDLGAYDRAKLDLTAVAALRPADPAVEDELVELEQKAGDFHAALARAQRMVERDPAHAHPRVLLGRLHRLAGDKALARGRESLGSTLVPDANAKASALLGRSAALDPKDPRRIAIANQLRDMLHVAEAARIEEVLDTVDTACGELEAARNAWIDSLAFGADPEAIAGLVDLFERAGEIARAIDLATITVHSPAMFSDPTFAHALMTALADLGRLRYASEIAATWGTRSTPVPADFLLDCCEILWRTRRTAPLNRAANTLGSIGTLPQISAAQLYIGFCFADAAAIAQKQDPAAARKSWQVALNLLQRFTATTNPDPFPDARAQAWKTIARATHELGDKVNERTALNGYLALQPEGDGEAWLRLAELELDARNAPIREVDLHFARGMALLPQRTEELLPRWSDIGADELRASGIDMENVRSNLQQGRAWNPPSDSPPFVRYRLAEVYATASDWLRAGAQVRALLDLVPGFVPALDLQVRIADGQGRARDRMDALVERVSRAGPTEKTDAILRDVRNDRLEPRDLLGLMRADPERTGRLALAGGLARHGHPAQALALLAHVGAKDLGDDGRLLAARLHLELREPDRALAILAAMDPEDLTQSEGIELFVRAALDAGETARLAGFTPTLARRLLRTEDKPDPKLARTSVFDRARALHVVDMLLDAGQADAAQPILAALDSTRSLRGPQVLLRMVASATLRGDTVDARDTLERAHAFDTKGAVDFEVLLVAAASDPDADLKALAHEVEAAGYVRAPLGHAQNLLVQGSTSDARVLLDAHLRGEHAADPWWNLTAAAAALQSPHAGPPELSAWLGDDAGKEAQLFLMGGDDSVSAGKPDPRRALVFVWAARDVLGAAFARAWLDHVDPAKQGDLWPEWIRAYIDEGQDFHKQAFDRLQRLLAHHPGFGPAWELQEQILDRSERSDAERAQFAKRRSEALGSSDGTEAERLVAQARAQRDAGALEEASKSARAALAADAWSLDARNLLAELQTRAGNDQSAFATLQGWLTLEAPDDGRAWPRPSEAADARFVRDYLAAMARLFASEKGTLTRTRAEAFLKTLAKQRPSDPRVVLAQAELDLNADERNPSMGVMRAYSRLDGFRTARKDMPLDDLAQGSVEAWAQFYERLDPTKAQAFLEAELALDPTRLETWMQSARAAEAGGDTALALKRMELCARLAPRGDVLREELRLRSLGDMEPEAIEGKVKAIVEAEGRTGPDAELVLLEARCFMNLGPRYLQRVLELLKGLDAWRDVSHSLHVQSAILSATAWMSRGTREDTSATQAVLADVRDEGDPYQRAYVRALWGLAHAP